MKGLLIQRSPWVCKAQMYVQDVDDAAYYWYFPTTLKMVTRKWLKGLQPSYITYL